MPILSKSLDPSPGLQSIESRSNLQDPLSTLPREILLFVLFSLSPFSIAHASAINRQWRSFIHSEPSMFSTVNLTSGRGIDGEETMEELEMTKLIGRLIRFSSLSNHKLKEVSLDMSSFHQDLVFTEEEQDGSRLVTLFQVLNLSSTLSKLYLQVPTFDKSDTESQECEQPDIIQMIVSLIDKLPCIPSLKEVEISAQIRLDLISSSSSKRLKITRARREYVDFDLDYSPIFESMVSFTGNGINEVIYDCIGSRSPRWDQISNLMEQSKESLKRLDLGGNPDVHYFVFGFTSFERTLRLATQCPNLTYINICASSYDSKVFRDYDEIIEEENAERSKLKVVKLYSKWVSFAGVPFFEWIGDQVEELDLGNCALNAITTEDEWRKVCFEDLFKSLGQSLKKLTWYFIDRFDESVFVDELSAGNLHLPSLTLLKLAGPPNFINVFLQAQIPSLESLQMFTYRFDPMPQSSINHKNLLKLLKSCQSSLVKVNIEEAHSIPRWKSSLEDHNRGSQMMGSEVKELEKVDHSFRLPVLESFRLEVEFKAYLKIYSSLQFRPDTDTILTGRVD